MLHFLYLNYIEQLAERPDSAAEYGDRRMEITGNIVRLEGALADCGDCPEKTQLEADLQYWRGLDRSLDDIIRSVLDWAGEGDPAWKAAWMTLLGMETPADGADYTPEEIVTRLRQSGSDERCIALYEAYQACVAERREGFHAGSEFGPCHEEHDLFRYCEAGDDKALADAERLQALRALGVILPEVKADNQRDYTLYYGAVPDDFVPPMPKPEQLSGRFLSIEMVKQGAGNLDSVRTTLFVQPMLFKGSEMFYQGDQLYFFIEDYSLLNGAPLLECHYVGNQLLTYYWYGTRPEAAEPGRLASRIPDHPVLQIGDARTDCPATG